MKARHGRVPVSCALLAATRQSDCSSVSHQQQAPQLQLSKTTNKPKRMFPILRKPVHYSERNPPLAGLPSFTLVFWISRPAALLTQGVLSAHQPTNQHLEGKPAAYLLPSHLRSKFCPVCLQRNPTLPIYVCFRPRQFLYFHWH